MENLLGLFQQIEMQFIDTKRKEYKVNIRILNPSDAEEYLALRLEALQESPHAFATTYEEEKDQTAEKYKTRFATPEKTFTFGAFEGDQLVGVVTLVGEKLIKLSHRTNIMAMYIKPEKRRSGLGSTLLSTAIEHAKSLEGTEQIYISVVTTNISAKKLYASFGFKVIGEEKRALKFGDTYYDEEHMVLFI